MEFGTAQASSVQLRDKVHRQTITSVFGRTFVQITQAVEASQRLEVIALKQHSFPLNPDQHQPLNLCPTFSRQKTQSPYASLGSLKWPKPQKYHQTEIRHTLRSAYVSWKYLLLTEHRNCLRWKSVNNEWLECKWTCPEFIFSLKSSVSQENLHSEVTLMTPFLTEIKYQLHKLALSSLTKIKILRMLK